MVNVDPSQTSWELTGVIDGMVDPYSVEKGFGDLRDGQRLDTPVSVGPGEICNDAHISRRAGTHILCHNRASGCPTPLLPTSPRPSHRAGPIYRTGPQFRLHPCTLAPTSRPLGPGPASTLTGSATAPAPVRCKAGHEAKMKRPTCRPS